MAKISPRALEKLKEDLSAPGAEGKAIRLVFEGFG
jgi:hypothetical protein